MYVKGDPPAAGRRWPLCMLKVTHHQQERGGALAYIVSMEATLVPQVPSIAAVSA